eukprot:TRINITY_DN10718_c0_g1_i3.p1 TRINITY_DN10718_c0_g1~~TRINITY_DN10718_c0_g1_i3.p1  ORF type:complete len:174 (-),score=47.26 TRINITY_DN10718_c0_g1_i3:39-560(-)
MSEGGAAKVDAPTDAPAAETHVDAVSEKPESALDQASVKALQIELAETKAALDAETTAKLDALKQVEKLGSVSNSEGLKVQLDQAHNDVEEFRSSAKAGTAGELHAGLQVGEAQIGAAELQQHTYALQKKLENANAQIEELQKQQEKVSTCLLYTSDAADEEDSGELGRLRRV